MLLDRIDHRDQRHEAKGKPARESLELITSHHRAYGHLLIARLWRPRVLLLDTNAMSAAEIAHELAEIFDAMRTPQLTEAHRSLNLR